MEDSRIIELYWQRSSEAVTASAEKYGGYCWTIAQNLLSDPRDAEECVNDTWLGAWNAMPPHRPQFLRVFFGKLTRSAACSRWRANAAQKRGNGELPLVLEELQECIPAAPSSEDQIENRELARSINRFLHALPERDCSIFLRRYWFGERISAIAERYALKENTVKSSLYRSRCKLKQYLEQEGIAL